jgi:hypothetical protein
VKKVEMDMSIGMRCYPTPACPEFGRCAHAINKDAVIAMNAMPYRAEGEACQWFSPLVEVEA